MSHPVDPDTFLRHHREENRRRQDDSRRSTERRNARLRRSTPRSF
ncbi:hypothetical protein [Nakamurella alba]|nr:hypothetical protein [Nakamurella alba]